MKPDLAKFAAAVRLRDRATAAAVEHHERAGLAPSRTYARATYDAIEQMIREDERERLAVAGRLLPADTDTRTETATIFGGKTSQRVVRTLADGSTLVGPWVSVPTTKETPDA